MKRTFTLLSLIIISVSCFAQAPRTVLLEWFTSTGCGPCTWQGPRMDSLHDNNLTSKLITIEYHGNYGNIDPMYFQNTAEPNARFSYYGFSGYPSGAVDGNYYTGHPNSITQTTINNRAAITSPFTIELSHKINNNGTINITAKAKAVQAISGSFKLHIMVVEKHIITRNVERNGETHWTNVMKKMLPNQNGTALAASWAVNDSATVNQSWTMANVYNVDQIAVVAFIQNTSTKEIVQAKFDDNSLKYNMDLNLADNVYTKFIGKSSTANYTFNANINSDSADTYEISLLNTLPTGWSADFTVNGTTYTNPTNINFNAIETKTISVNVTSSSAGDERATVTLQVKSTSRIGSYKKQFPTYTFCSVTNLVDDKFKLCDTMMVNALHSKGLSAVTISDYELDGLDTNGMNKNTLTHFIYNVTGKNIFLGITENKLQLFRNYLKSHGNFLVISETLGEEVNNSWGYFNVPSDYFDFYANYIGANYISYTFINTSNPMALNYSTGDSMFKYAGNTQLTSSLGYVEWFTPTLGSKATLKFSNDASKTGGSARFNAVDNWKIAYWGFNFSSLNKTDGYRSNILKTTIDWFDGLPLSVQSLDNKNISFSVYPNPANDVVTVSTFGLSGKNNQLKIVDLMGKTVKTILLSDNLISSTIELSDLTNGIYFVQLINNNEIVGTKKFVVAR